MVTALVCCATAAILSVAASRIDSAAAAVLQRGQRNRGRLPMMFGKVRVQPRNMRTQRLRRFCRTRNQGSVNASSHRVSPDTDPSQRRVEITGLGMMHTGMNPGWRRRTPGSVEGSEGILSGLEICIIREPAGCASNAQRTFTSCSKRIRFTKRRGTQHILRGGRDSGFTVPADTLRGYASLPRPIH